MTELEYREISLRLHRLEQNKMDDFLLGIYTDLVRQHINLLKDLVHNRFSSEDYENQIRLERDVKILEKSLNKLNELIISKEKFAHFPAETEEIAISIEN